MAYCLGYEVVGDPELEVTKVTFPEDSDKESIAICRTKKDLEHLEADVAMVRPMIINTDKTLVYSMDSTELAMVKTAGVLRDNGYYCDYGMPVEYKQLEPNILIGRNVKIGKSVHIDPFTTIGNDIVIGDGSRISSHSVINSGCIIGKNVRIGAGTIIGADSFFHYHDEGLKTFVGVGRAVLGDDVEIGSNCIIQRGSIADTVIGERTKLGNLIDIGHDVRIGKGCKIVSQTGIAGNAVIGNYVMIYGQVAIINYVTVGDGARIMAKSMIIKNILPGKVVSGLSRDHMDEMRLQAKLRKLNIRR